MSLETTMIGTPKTITLYGRGKRRYAVVPGAWADCLKEARRLKAWAARVKDDRKWKAGACQMSLDHLAHVLATDVADLAKEGYRYLEIRAHLGNPQCWDRPARERWLKLGGRIRRPRKATKPKQRIWVRVGDMGQYESFDSLDDALDYLNELSAGQVTGWVEGGMGVGIETVNYHGYDFVSLFWGDAGANLTTRLNDNERMKVEEGLKEVYI